MITGDSEAEVRAMIDADPAVRSGTFVFELHPMNVFYPGCVDPRKE